VNDRDRRHTVETVRALLSTVAGADRVRQLQDGDLLFERRIIDSLHLVEFVERLEQAFGLVLEGADLTPTNFSSLQAIAQFVDSRQAPT
jgi:acyl carrier protein